MNRNTLFKSAWMPFLLFSCIFLLLSPEAFAAPADEDDTPVKLSAEELSYRERSGEITIGCQIKNRPLLFRNEKTGQLEGITIDVLDMIEESTGLKFRYQALPSGKITYEDLQALQVDMVAGVEFSESNANSPGIAITAPYLHAEKVFVCKKGEVFRPDREMVIAVNSGSQTLTKTIHKKYPKFRMLFCDSTEEALSALLSGEADAVLENQYMINRILCRPIYENLQIVAAASIGDSQCLACLVPVSDDGQSIISDDTALLLSVLNKGIASLDQSQVSFLIIRKTAENAYQFTMWDMMYRYRHALAVLLISLMMIFVLLRKNHLLRLKRSEQIATQRRAEELAAINAHMKEQQLLLMDALKRAEEGNRARTTFLFNMSHDIRTPMNAILGFAEIACRSKGDDARLTDCLQKIQASGRQLMQLLNNVLDMAKIENGEVTLTEDHCNLEECIEKARDSLQAEIRKKHLTFRIDTSDVQDKEVCCDSLRVGQILFNLLSNAVKFNRPGGSVLVRLRQSPCDIREYAAYEIIVKDTGIGMSPEFLPRIFEPFEREYTSTISQTQGTGLGMPITKNIVDLMGGTIQVSSVPDEGTEVAVRFTFKLPEQAGQPEQQARAEDAPANNFSGRRVLLVEDNELNMEIAQVILSGSGFLVETAENGRIAVDMVRNSAPGYYDVVLMDIQMPVMDGYQASREIRSLENKELARVPIIALTANTSDEDKKKSLANGMNAHVAKPLDIKVLYKALRDNLKRK